MTSFPKNVYIDKLDDILKKYNNTYHSMFKMKLVDVKSNRCCDLLMISINLRDIAILNVKGSDYRCIINLISKNEAINLLQKADLTEISQTL